MTRLTGRIFAGHLRSIVGSMTVEDLIRERQKLAKKSSTSRSQRWQRLDWLWTPFRSSRSTIRAPVISRHSANPMSLRSTRPRRSPSPPPIRLLLRLGRSRIAIRRNTPARLLSPERSMTPKSKPHRPRPLKPVRWQPPGRTGRSRRTGEGGRTQRELRQQQLIAEVVRPAEAEAERIKTLATAEAAATRVGAEAAAANDRVALDQQLITLLPQVVKGMSEGLAKANITILNGAEGYNETVSGLVGQSMAVLDALRAGIHSGPFDATRARTALCYRTLFPGSRTPNRLVNSSVHGEADVVERLAVTRSPSCFAGAVAASAPRYTVVVTRRPGVCNPCSIWC